MSEACFTAADILLPAAGVPLDPWACIAVDQFTSQPEYWQRAEHLADGKPSTLHIVLPEAYLGTPQEAERLESIRRTMEEYRKTVLTRKVHGYVYVERTQMDGTVRQGLVGAVDLDAYDYAKGSKPAIRPSESTVVERIPPRLKVRRGATLETPHVMMLADDADCTLIEPIGLMKNQLPPLYDGELMLGGGHLRGWAVEDPALIARIDAALAALADRDEFVAQVKQHCALMEKEFGVKPTAFRNTELIYSDHIGEVVASMGFRTMLAEGAKHVLGWKSPNYVYANAIDQKLHLLLRNFKLSDDIAFRFSDRGWSQWPLTAEKYVSWLNNPELPGEVINLFMD